MPRPRRRGTVVARLALFAVTGVLLAACVPSHSRPSLGEPATVTGPPPTTGNPFIDALTARLDAAGSHGFSADYTVVRKLGSVSGTATVSSAPPKLAVRVGDVLLLRTGVTNGDATCNLKALRCEDGFLEQRISDFAVGSQFFGPAPARQLRVSARRSVGNPVFTHQAVAGVASDCVALPFTGGSETYCVTSVGVLSLLDTAAVHIELTALRDSPDANAFQRPDGK